MHVKPFARLAARADVSAGGGRVDDNHGAGTINPSASPEFSSQQITGAVSKLISASIGDVCVVFSRSAAHKHYTFADMEWMVLPAVVTGQAYVAEAQHTESGARAPVAAVLWARVSDETDQRLTATLGQKIRLRPDEWASGDNFWIIDVAGDPRAVVAALKTLLGGPLKDHDVKVATVDAQGAPRVEMLRDVAARVETPAGGPAS
ncbi:MAG: toxin-activating lysine-acyltransferase [Hyphomicrobium sp.]